MVAYIFGKSANYRTWVYFFFKSRSISSTELCYCPHYKCSKQSSRCWLAPGGAGIWTGAFWTLAGSPVCFPHSHLPQSVRLILLATWQKRGCVDKRATQQLLGCGVFYLGEDNEYLMVDCGFYYSPPWELALTADSLYESRSDGKKKSMYWGVEGKKIQ